MTNRQLSVILVVLLLGGVVLGANTLVRGPSEVERRLVELFEAQQDVLAEQAAMRLRDSLREVEVRLATAGDQEWAVYGETPTPEQFDEALTRLSHHSDPQRGISLALLGVDGRLLAVSRHTETQRVASLVSNSALAQPVSTDGEMRIYRPGVPDPSDVLVTIPLDEQHVLAASVDLDTLAGRIFEQVTGHRNTRAALLDTDGQSIYSRDTPPKAEPSEWVAGTARVPNTGLTVEISAPRSVIAPEVDEQVRAVALRGFGVLGLFLGSMGIVVILLRRQQRARVAQIRLLAHQDKLVTLGMMAASTAHEIRNAITVADLQLQVARASANAETSRHLEKAAQSVDRLAGLAESLSRYGKKEQTDNALFALSSAVDEALAVAEPKIARKTEVITDTEDGLQVFGSRSAIVQVIVNLVLNAVDAIETRGNGGTIEIRTWRDRDEAIIEVTDSGEGIEPAVLGKLFEPFFSTKSGDETSGGTGIGLWLCAQIIEQHGGTITAGNVESGGARFVVRLPVELQESTGSNTARNESDSQPIV